MTRADMKTNIRYALGLREPEEQPFIDAEIQRGIYDVLRRTSCFVQCLIADVPDDKNRIEFASQGGIMKALHVVRGGVVMDRTTFPPLPGTFSQIGQILYFADSFAPGEQLQLYAVPRPQAIPADTHDLAEEQYGGIPEEFQDAVELYACAKLASRMDDGTSQNGNNYWILYVGQDGASGRIAEIKRQVNRMSGMTLGPARLRTFNGRATGPTGNGNGNGFTIGVVGPMLSNDLMAQVTQVTRQPA